jgi:hypothetical protein
VLPLCATQCTNPRRDHAYPVHAPLPPPRACARSWWLFQDAASWLTSWVWGLCWNPSQVLREPQGASCWHVHTVHDNQWECGWAMPSQLRDGDEPGCCHSDLHRQCPHHRLHGKLPASASPSWSGAEVWHRKLAGPCGLGLCFKHPEPRCLSSPQGGPAGLIDVMSEAALPTGPTPLFRSVCVYVCVFLWGAGVCVLLHLAY